MKQIIKQWLRCLDFATSGEVQLIKLEGRENQKRLTDIELTASDFEDIYKEVVETNQRLKKLEEYLKVEYTVIPEKIEYKKRK